MRRLLQTEECATEAECDGFGVREQECVNCGWSVRGCGQIDFLTPAPRLNRARDYFKRDRSNGERRWSKEGYRRKLRTPYQVRPGLIPVCFETLLDRKPDFTRHSNVYGIDMPSRPELVGYKRNTEEIAKAIGADLVIFQTLSDLVSAVQQLNPEIKSFDCSVFTGEYVTGGVDEEYLEHLERVRADNVKDKVHIGGIGPMEGKGGGGVKRENVDGHTNGATERKGAEIGSSGPMNGADDTVGLYNSWTGPR